MSPKPKGIKTKTNKQHLIKLKNFFTVKETINSVKRQPTEWTKILVNEMTDSGLIFEICKQLIQFNIFKKQQHNFKKWAETKIHIFPKKT